MSSNYKKVHAVAFMALAATWCLSPQVVSAGVETNVISQVTWDRDSETGEFTLHVTGSQVPVYTMYELFSPQRIVLDIASGEFDQQLSFPLTPDNAPITSITGAIVTGQEMDVARLELGLTQNSVYKIEQNGSEVVVTFSLEENSFPDQVIPEASLNSVITDIQVDAITSEKATVVIYSSGPIGAFTVVEEPKDEMHSARIIVNLPAVQAEDKVIPVVLDSPIALVQSKGMVSSTGSRLILDSADNDLFTYDIQAQGNYLELTLMAKANGSDGDAEMVALLTGHGAEGSRDDDFLAFAEESPELATMAFDNDEFDTPVATPDISNVNFAGYGEQKISVDFYKIDLHNVFRLIGEISNRNIIVDESVSGSLTLSMKDVPWDFLLDVVLNLKDLSKEERFNTIVISPKSEGFTWPESVATELEITVEPITVTKRLQTAKEKIEAKKLIHQAGKFDEKGDTLAAIAMYEKAFLMWPENGDLANRIAVIALAKLGQNAKAAHYAKIAVQENPEDYKAALIAGMSLANMEQVQEAKEYFDLAVSGMRPSKHAIASYAAFSEQNGSYDAALALLDQYAQVYGNTLETMISRARIYDSMGSVEQADAEYNAILLSGYELPADLKTYMTNRVNGQ